MSIRPLYITALLIFFSLPLSLLNAAGPFPYQASITHDEAFVRSGPGNAYYSTSSLKKGDVIEVYQETEDGWCAIRPPIGSFSWVSGAYIEVGLDNIGTVTVEGLASRIGSQVHDECKTVQVRFRKGTKVFVLERVETPENQLSPSWYKIAPPKGEFRWVHCCAFGNDHNCQASHLPKAAKNPLEIDQSGFEAAPLVVPSLARTVAPVGPESQKAGSRGFVTTSMAERTTQNQPGTIIPVQYLEDSQFEAFNANESFEMLDSADTISPPAFSDEFEIVENPGISPPVTESRPERNNENTNPAHAAAPPERMAMVIHAGPNVTNSVSPARNLGSAQRNVRLENIDPFVSEFTELQSEAFKVMSTPTEDWVFDVLLERANDLYKQASTESEQNRVHRLIEALDKTRLARRELGLMRQQDAIRKGKPLQTSSSSTLVNGRSSIQGNTTGITQTSGITQTAVRTPVRPQQSQSPFHAVGRLGRVTNNEIDALPPYAIADNQSRIICYVSPADGVNLNQHIGKMVGMNGLPGRFIKEGQSFPHLEADTVFALEK